MSSQDYTLADYEKLEAVARLQNDQVGLALILRLKASLLEYETLKLEHEIEREALAPVREVMRKNDIRLGEALRLMGLIPADSGVEK